MIYGRHGNAVGVLIDHDTNKEIIAVVGGIGIGNNKKNSVELLVQGQTNWMRGVTYKYYV